MEAITDDTYQGVTSWDLGKLRHAERLLKFGHSPEQVGTKLCLSRALIDELQVDYENLPVQPQVETHEEWRRRKATEVEKKLVGIVDSHLDGVAEIKGMILPETMATVRDASQIAHKWLRNGEDGAKHLTLNFSALAQVRASSPPDGTAETIDITPQTE